MSTFIRIYSFIYFVILFFLEKKNYITDAETICILIFNFAICAFTQYSYYTKNNAIKSIIIFGVLGIFINKTIIFMFLLTLLFCSIISHWKDYN